MMRGRPAVYATFSSYDEVAHHSGLERADTLEALRKLDEQFGRIDRARRYAPRPYELVVLSDHGQTQGATFKQRNGYGLDELVAPLGRVGHRRADARRRRERHDGRRRRSARPPARRRKKKPKNDVSDQDVIVLGSGNLGLIYLMEERRRLTLEEIERAPSAPDPGAARAPARRLPPRPLGRARAGCARRERNALPRRRSHRGRGPARPVLAERPAAPAAHRRLRARGGHHGQQLLRRGARRGLRVRGADLLPRRHGRDPDPRRSSSTRPRLPLPDEPIVGAAAVHGVLTGWRRTLQG